MYAFLSYQSEDKAIATAINKVLQRMGVESILAREDIDVSKEWRFALLREIRKTECSPRDFRSGPLSG
jgi:hypothetical protein